MMCFVSIHKQNYFLGSRGEFLWSLGAGLVL
jgi:hypothetical protein